MKKFFIYLIASITLIGCANSEGTNSSSPETVAKEKLPYEIYLHNEVEPTNARLISRYIYLSSSFDFKSFNVAEAKERVDELGQMMVSGEVEADLEATLLGIAEGLESGAIERIGGANVSEIGLYQDKEAETNDDYDSTFYVISTNAILDEDEKISSETCLVGMVWMKEGKINSTIGVGDLGEKVDFEEFFTKTFELSTIGND